MILINPLPRLYIVEMYMYIANMNVTNALEGSMNEYVACNYRRKLVTTRQTDGQTDAELTKCDSKTLHELKYDEGQNVFFFYYMYVLLLAQTKTIKPVIRKVM